jgi:hypothetical protein
MRRRGLGRRRCDQHAGSYAGLGRIAGTCSYAYAHAHAHAHAHAYGHAYAHAHAYAYAYAHADTYPDTYAHARSELCEPTYQPVIREHRVAT